MKPAISLQPATRAFGAREAWTVFWQDPAQSRCAAGDAEIWRALAGHWSGFAAALRAGTRVLDLGCGAGAVPRELVAAGRALQITGVDFARIPLTIHPHIDLLSDTAMENLPFANASFGAVVSQFGFEYSRIEQVSLEIARVAARGAQLSLLVHHADSAVVAANRARLRVLNGFLAPAMRAAFCAGDAGAFQAQLASLVAKHPQDGLLCELARSVPSRLDRAQRERLAIWNALEDALAPERCIAEALQACCLPAGDFELWSRPLRGVCAALDAAVLREPGGQPIAWRIAGRFND
jgi:SAM-dependent methyltransferase